MGSYEVGEAIPAVTSPPVGRMNIAYMAVAMRDPNAVHVEEEVARAAGLPQVVAHGTFPLAYAGVALTRAFGFDAVERFAVALTAPVFPGDRLTTSAVVAEQVPGEDGGRLRLDVQVRKDDGTVVGRGGATVRVR